MTPGPPRTQRPTPPAGEELARRQGVRRKACQASRARVSLPALAWARTNESLARWPEHKSVARNAPAISPRAAEKTFCALLLLLTVSQPMRRPPPPRTMEEKRRRAWQNLIAFARYHRLRKFAPAWRTYEGFARDREPAAGRRSCTAPAEAPPKASSPATWFWTR